MKIFNDITAYIKNVTDLLWDFINHREQYPKNALLAVQPEVMVTVIDNPEDCKECDFYDPMTLMDKDREGQLKPSKKNIFKMASRYF